MEGLSWSPSTESMILHILESLESLSKDFPPPRASISGLGTMESFPWL